MLYISSVVVVVYIIIVSIFFKYNFKREVEHKVFVFVSGITVFYFSLLSLNVMKPSLVASHRHLVGKTVCAPFE